MRKILILILSALIGSGSVFALGEKSQKEGGGALKTGKGIDLKTKTIKIGTLNDHSWFKPESAIFCVDKQEYHQLPEGIPAFEKLP